MKIYHQFKIYGIFNFQKHVCGGSDFCQILTIVLELHTNTMYQKRIFGIEFHQNELKHSDFLGF